MMRVPRHEWWLAQLVRQFMWGTFVIVTLLVVVGTVFRFCEGEVP